MKKLFAVVMCLIVTLCFIPAIAFAEESYPINCTIDKAEVKPGDNLHVIAKCDAPTLSKLSLTFDNYREGVYTSKTVNLSETSEGVFEGDLQIDEYFVNGTFTLGGWGHDALGYTLINSDNVQFIVTGGSDDVTCPEIKTLSYNKSVLEPGEKLIITAEIEEENDLEKFKIFFHNPDGKSISAMFNKMSKNTYQAEVNITTATSIGTYSIRFISLEDKCGHSTGYDWSNNDFPFGDKEYEIQVEEPENKQTCTFNFSIDKTSVVPGDVVHITATASGNCTDKVLPHIQIENGNNVRGLNYVKTSENTYEWNVVIDENYPNGKYIANISYGCSDAELLDTIYVNFENAEIIFFNVTNATDDLNKPLIKSIDFSKKSYTLGDTIIVTVNIEDESEIKEASISLFNSNSNSVWPGVGGFGGLLKKVEDNKYQVEFTVNEKNTNGTYRIYSISAVDSANNNTYYQFGTNEFPFNGSEYEFTVFGASDDIKAPVLKSLTVDESNITYSQMLTFTAVVEEESNIPYFHSTMVNQGVEINLNFKKTSEDTYTAQYYVDETLPKGTYKTTFVETVDEFGNASYLTNYDECKFVNNIPERTTISFDGGDGTEERPYLISTKEQLNEVRYFKNSSFKLTSDILFSEDDFSENGLFYNSGLGWIPICYADSTSINVSGNSLDAVNSFRGKFDGDGHVISGLKVSDHFNYSGLFGITDGATIKDVKLTDAYIYGKRTAGGIVGFAFNTKIGNCNNKSTIRCISDAGGITGYGFGCSISDCKNEGSVSSTYKDTDTYELGSAGGIVGYCEYNTELRRCNNSGNISGNCVGGILGKKLCDGASGTGIIEQCENSGVITGYSCAGGIAGLLDDQAYIEKKVRMCCNSGSVTSSGLYVGGIVGANYDYDVQNCYNKGDIISPQALHAGGIVGYLGCPFTDLKYTGSINNCYNSGNIKGLEYIGGVIGYRKTGAVNNNYYLNNVAAGIGNEVDRDIVKSCTISELKNQKTFAGFDFSNTWKFINEFDYPVLKWQDGTDREGSQISGGGDGGGVPVTPAEKPAEEPTQSGKTTTTDLSGSTISKDGETTTTVDKIIADKLVETAVSNKSEEIVISAVTKNESVASSTKSAEVTLPAGTLGEIAEKTDADVVIKTDVAEVKLDNQAVEAIAEQAQTAAGTEGKAETVSIIAEKVKEEADEVSFELKVVTSSGKVISDFNGGSVSITVNVPKSLSNKKLVCVYIDENGLKHRVDGQLNADGTYTFTTGHFSTYAIMTEEDAEKAIKEQKEAIKAMKFKLRSQLVKTKSGKKAVKLTWTNPSDIEFEGVAIYRSTKKNTGYGKKPIYVSKSDKYINTAVKSGKKYYYKVRAFVTIDGEKVYTDYSYKAYRTVK